MPTPEFILELRKKVGHDLLWLMGVSGYVEDEQGRVLLGRRSDTGEWAMVYGINEPGEEPADTVAREVKEETGVDVIVTDLVSVKSSRKMLTYANGDNTMYMDHLFVCKPDPNGNAEPFVGDEKASTWVGSPLMTCLSPWPTPQWNAWATCVSTSRTRRTATHTRNSPSTVRFAEYSHN